MQKTEVVIIDRAEEIPKQEQHLKEAERIAEDQEYAQEKGEFEADGLRGEQTSQVIEKVVPLTGIEPVRESPPEGF